MRLARHLSLLAGLAAAAAPAAHADGHLDLTLQGLPDPPRPPARAPRITESPNHRVTHRPNAPTTRKPLFVGKLAVTRGTTNLYRWANPASPVISRVPRGTYLALVSGNNTWAGVLMADNTIGWAPAYQLNVLNYDVVRDATPQPSATGRSGFDSPVPPAQSSQLGPAVVQLALRYLGVPYVWGGNTTRGLDCSGLVKRVFDAFGRYLPRRGREQMLVGEPVTELQPGDRLYFQVKARDHIDHTGIYIGNGYMVHASMSRGRVDIDRVARLARYLVAARRSY